MMMMMMMYLISEKFHALAAQHSYIMQGNTFFCSCVSKFHNKTSSKTITKTLTVKTRPRHRENLLKTVLRQDSVLRLTSLILESFMKSVTGNANRGLFRSLRGSTGQHFSISCDGWVPRLNALTMVSLSSRTMSTRSLTLSLISSANCTITSTLSDAAVTVNQ